MTSLLCLHNLDATNRGRSHLHSIHTFLLLHDLPDLVLFTTSQDHRRGAIWSVPAMLTILMLHCDPLASAQTFAVRREVLINGDRFDAVVRAHIRASATLFRFLARSAHEAEFVGVFARVFGDADVFEGTEHVVGAEMFGEVVGVFGLRLFGVFEGFSGGCEAFTGFGDFFGFGAGGGGIVGEDAVVNKGLAEIVEFVVHEGADGGWEVACEGVDWCLLA